MKKLLGLAFALVFAFAVNTNAQMIGIQGALGLPMGDFGDVYDMGFGATGTYFYEPDGGAFQITGSIGFFSFSGELDLGPFGTQDYSVTFIPINAGARYMFSEGEFAPYGGAEVGYTLVSYEGGVSDNNIGLGPMLGFMYELGRNLNLDVNAKYNVILTSGSSTSYVGIYAGVVFGL